MANLPEVGVTATVKNVDGFMRDMGKIANAVAKTEAAVWNAGASGVKAAGQMASGVRSVISGIGSAVGMAQQVVGTIGQILGETLGRAIEYNHVLFQISNTTGLATEEVGQLTAVYQGLGLTMSQAAAVFTNAMNKGFIPSIANMAALADEARLIADPMERMAFLEDRVGNSAADLVPLLMQGGDAIRGMTAAVDESLAPSAEMVAQTEKMRENISKLAAETDALKLKLGNLLATRLTPVVEGFNNMSDALQEQFDNLMRTTGSFEEFQLALEDQWWPVKQIGQLYTETSYDAQKLAVAERDLSIATEGSTETLLLNEKAAKEAAKAAEQLAREQEKTAKDVARAAEEQARDVEKAYQAQRQSLTSYFDFITGGGGQAISEKLSEYARNLEFGGQMDFINEKRLDELIANNMLSAEQAETLASSLLPKEAFKKWADEWGYEMGQKISGSMVNGIKDEKGKEVKQGLRDALLETGLSPKAVEKWLKEIKVDPAQFIETQQDVFQAMMGDQFFETGVEGMLTEAEVVLPEHQPVWDAFWQNPLRRAMEMAEELVVLGEKTALVYSSFMGPVSPPQYATGTPHASSGNVDNSQMNLTVNTSAPVEPIEADFRLLKAMKRSR